MTEARKVLRRFHDRSTGNPWGITSSNKEERMVAFVVLLLILALFGGLGFAAHVLWLLLLVALVLWVVGFFVGGVEAAGMGRRRWYGRW